MCLAASFRAGAAGFSNSLAVFQLLALIPALDGVLFCYNLLTGTVFILLEKIDANQELSFWDIENILY